MRKYPKDTDEAVEKRLARYFRPCNVRHRARVAKEITAMHKRNRYVVKAQKERDEFLALQKELSKYSWIDIKNMNC
ncbi:MAG: hypothetical protein Edafosvirus1_18 [Edafosvirus sp.]|uniref:Uncharacterized protein n=1 Tax=Edafosvirus sp. TaxID=2487765 RepID=A0A3G4ZS02_9VIRU|nr:MAG: hypothetical protein Edafosvirus1_18 [Edafosvirus sp.]